MSVNILNRYTGAILAVMPGSSLVGADFAGLNITNADLSNTDLTNAKFGGCVCPGSTFQNSNLSGTNFQKGNVQGSDFRGTTKTSASNFHQCFFEDVILDPGDQNVGAWALPSGYGGQSNAQGNIAGATSGLPDASIPFAFSNLPNGTSGGAWGPLEIDPSSGFHGAEILFCQTLKALGFDIGCGKITHGATTMSDWVVGSANWTTDVLTSLPSFMSSINTVWPGKFSRWSWAWYLGEDDARANGNGATNYGEHLLNYLVGISGLVGQNVWKWFICVRTQSWLANNVPNSLFDCRRWEVQYGNQFLNVDDLAHQGDNVHLTAASQDTLGQRWAAAWQLVIPGSTP